MGKLQRKKNNVPFVKGAAPVAITLQAVDIQMCAHDKLECIFEFVKMLSECASLNEQIKACQMFRGTIKKFVLSESIEKGGDESVSSETAAMLTKSLVYLYLYPTMFPIRKSLDWVVDIAIRKRLVSANELASVLQGVTKSLLQKFDDELGRLSGGSESRSDHYWCMEWVMSFSFFLVCERDSGCQWLCAGSNLANSCTSSTNVGATGYVFAMLDRLGQVVNLLGAQLLVSRDSQEAGLSSSAALLEVFEESLRLSSSMVKAARAGLLAAAGSTVSSALAADYGATLDSCSVFAPTFLPAVLATGKLSFVTQDIVNSINLCVASVKWAADMLALLRDSSSASESDSLVLQQRRIVLQLHYVCSCLHTAESFSAPARAYVSPMHELLTAVDTRACAAAGGTLAPFLSESEQQFAGDAEFAFSALRAYVSVIDDDALVYLFAAEQGSGSGSVLARLLAGVATNLSSSPNNSLCLLGLQNLDTLYCRFQGVHQVCADPEAAAAAAARTSHAAVDLAAVAGRAAWFDCVRLGSDVLTRNWISSNKQIGHLVPMVFDRLVAITRTLLAAPAGVAEDMAAKVWGGLIEQALAQPANHRGRYQALTILFDSIPVAITQQLLSAQQQEQTRAGGALGRSLVADLVEAVKLRDISSASCSCLCTLLKKMKGSAVPAKVKGAADAAAEAEHSASLAAFRDLWVPALVDALCGASVVEGTAASVDDDSGAASVGPTAEGAGVSQSSRNIAEYLIPEITGRVDSGCIPHIIDAVRARSGLTAEKRLWGLCQLMQNARQLGVAGSDLLDDEVQENLSPGSGGVGTEPVVLANSGQVRVGELRGAFVSSVVDICLVAFSAVVLSLKTIVPYSDLELGLIRFGFRYVVKCPLPDHRHKICRIVRSLMTRVKESTRVSVRDIAQLKIKITKLGEGADVSREREIMAELQRVVDVNVEFSRWLSAEIVSGLQPGCTYDMQMMLMDILNTVVDALQAVSLQQQQVHLDRLQGMQAAGAGAGVALQLGAAATQCLGADLLQQCFYTPDIVLATLQFCVSSWDRCRHTAADLLLKLPAPLPGIGAEIRGGASAERSIQSVLSWAYSLANSVRQRESDAGAYILRDLFHVYVLKLGWRLSVTGDCLLEAGPRNELAAGVVLYSSSCTVFLNGLCDDLEARLGVLTSMYTYILSSGGVIRSSNTAEGEEVATGPAPVLALAPGTDSATADWQSGSVEYVSQGVIWTLVHCINQILEADALNPARLRHAYGAEACDVLLGEWGGVVSRLHELTFRGFGTALMMVAEASTDTYFAPIVADHAAASQAGEDADTGAAKGPVHANSFMMVNTNGYLGATSGEGADDDFDEADGDEDDEGVGEGKSAKVRQSMIMQRAVVSAWLLAKSSVAAIVRLVEIQPSFAALPASCVPPVPRFVPAGMGYIEHCGNLLVDALSRLRHLGAILEVQVALQRICEIVLHPPAEGKQGGGSSAGGSANLCHLPKRWLDLLLNRLQNEQQVFILRRSAGFAYSFLSILRAEGPSKTTAAAVSLAPDAENSSRSSLLQFTMLSLLRIASKDVNKDQQEAGEDASAANEDEGEEGASRGWRRCVHAINILRLILLDGTLTAGTDAYLASSCQLAITGFRSARWGIRNSCMMLFTAVVQKSVDNEKNDGKNVIARRTLTVAAYFRKHPQLYPFIVAELRRAMAPSANEREDQYKQQSLYPILLLFAKLKPAFAAADTPEGREVVSVLTGLTERCVGAREGKTRIICARALASIVPVEYIPAKVRALCEDCASNCASPNELHGTLLIIHALCDSLYRHRLHFHLIYSVENSALLERVDSEAARSMIPCFVQLVHAGLMQRNLPLTVLAPSAVMVHLKICHCLLSTGYDGELALPCNPAKLGIAAFLQQAFRAKCWDVIGSLQGALVSPGGDVLDLTTLCSVPFAPLLYQAVLEYHVFHCMFQSDVEVKAEADGRLHIMELFCHERLGVDMSEVQMGVVVGVHAALDQPAEITNWSLVNSLVHLVICMLTKRSCTFSSDGDSEEDRLLRTVCAGRDWAGGSYRYGFTETVLESTLALLNRLVRRRRFRESMRGLFVHCFTDLWRALSEMVAVSAAPASGGAGVPEISPTSLACNALELLGWMVQLCMERTGSDGVELLAGWCAQLESACLETQPLQVRLFCARALLHSGLLSGASSSGVCCDVLPSCWATVLTLLQVRYFGYAVAPVQFFYICLCSVLYFPVGR
mgnify:CR=1 FL=1